MAGGHSVGLDRNTNGEPVQGAGPGTLVAFASVAAQAAFLIDLIAPAQPVALVLTPGLRPAIGVMLVHATADVGGRTAGQRQARRLAGQESCRAVGLHRFAGEIGRASCRERVCLLV